MYAYDQIRPMWPLQVNSTSYQSAGLQLWVPMIHTSGPATKDLSGRGRNGTRVLNEKWSATNIFSGTGAEFTNTNQYIDFGDSSWLPTAQIAIAFWERKSDTTNRASAAFGINDANGATRCSAHLPYNDNNAYWDFGGSTNGVTRVTSSSGVTGDTNLRHWVLTVGPRGMEIWLNSNLIGSNGATPTRTSTTAAFRVNQFGGATIDGDIVTIYDFRVYDRQLSMGEIRGMYDPPSRYDVYNSLGREVFPGAASAAAAARSQIIIIG